MDNKRDMLDVLRTTDKENTYIIYTGETKSGLAKYGYYEVEHDESMLGRTPEEDDNYIAVWDNDRELHEIDNGEFIPCMKHEDAVKKAVEMGCHFERQLLSNDYEVRGKDGRWICFKSELPKYFAMQGKEVLV